MCLYLYSFKRSVLNICVFVFIQFQKECVKYLCICIYTVSKGVCLISLYLYLYSFKRSVFNISVFVFIQFQKECV